MITLLLMVGALAAPPTACDTSTDAADTDGFCLTEEDYLEIGDLRKRVKTLETTVDAKDEEIESFEMYRARQEANLKFTVTSMTDTYDRGIDLVVSTCKADLEACNKRGQRKFMERHGFAVGIIAGVVTTTALTAVTLEVYGNILNADTE